MNLAQMSKRDLKAPSITAYYHKLASNIPDDVEDRTSLVESYMKYVDYLVKEQEKELHKWKKRSYSVGRNLNEWGEVWSSKTRQICLVRTLEQ